MYSEISPKQAFKLVIYLLFFSLGVYFIYQGDVLARFAQQKTNYAIRKEAIRELPTITTFITPPAGLKLGTDFNLTFQALRSGATNSSTEPTQ